MGSYAIPENKAALLITLSRANQDITKILKSGGVPDSVLKIINPGSGKIFNADSAAKRETWESAWKSSQKPDSWIPIVWVGEKLASTVSTPPFKWSTVADVMAAWKSLASQQKFLPAFSGPISVSVKKSLESRVNQLATQIKRLQSEAANPPGVLEWLKSEAPGNPVSLAVEAVKESGKELPDTLRGVGEVVGRVTGEVTDIAGSIAGSTATGIVKGLTTTVGGVLLIGFGVYYLFFR